MSRLYGRVEDVNSISKYLIEKYSKVYQPDKTIIEDHELIEAPILVFPYLSSDTVKYINDCNIQVYWDKRIDGTVYSGQGEEENCIIFNTKQMIEEYKTDLIYFIGDLLRRKNLDYMQDEHDIMCQYSDVLPLLIEYLFYKEQGKVDTFSERNLSDLALNSKSYVKLYERFNRHQNSKKEYELLNNTLLHLIPLSSMDATLQLIDKIGNNKDELVLLIQSLIDNKNHNREDIINERNISTYGFKRLRKEIDFRR